MRPNDAVIAADALVEHHARYHYLTKPEMRRMARAIIAEMEPPADVPGVSDERLIAAFKRVREQRADKYRDRSAWHQHVSATGGGRYG